MIIRLLKANAVVKMYIKNVFKIYSLNDNKIIKGKCRSQNVYKKCV
jgi:hypothetical protein